MILPKSAGAGARPPTVPGDHVGQLPFATMTLVEVEEAQPVGRRGTVTPIEWLALVAGILPLVVICGWALVERWVPIGDSGQLVVRSRDVFTANHPFVGAWSSSSIIFSSNINNLGSLYSVLLAPFTRVEPYGGAAVGMTVVNVACVVGVWASARSVFGRIGAVGSMLATLALIASTGAVSLLQTRQQLALLMPFWCLLWATIALWRGRAWAAPLVVFLFSLTAQTHFTFIYQSAALALSGAIAFVVGQRKRFADPQFRRPLYVAAIVGLLCWVQPLWDQFFGMGNLGHVLGHSDAPAGQRPGFGVGALLISRAGLRPPFWLPGSMGRFDSNPTYIQHGNWAAWVIVGLWFGAIISMWVWARSTRRPGIAALSGVAAVALASALFAASQIPPVTIIYPGQNYYWMWPIVILLTMAPAAAIASTLLERPAHRPRLTVAAVVALVIAVLVASNIASYIDQVSYESFNLRRSARSLVGQVSAGLDTHPVKGAVLIDYGGDFQFSVHRYTFLAELQRRHIPFVFDGAGADIFRFGTRRCAERSVGQSLLFRSGRAVGMSPDGGAILLARVDASRKEYEHASAAQ